MCPTGCELKKSLVKQERNVRPTVDQLKRAVDDLYQSSNNVYGYVTDMTTEVAQRQRVSQGNILMVEYRTYMFRSCSCIFCQILSIITGNDALVSQYTESLETQHAFIKEAVDITFPQNIRILQSVLEKVRDKIQRLEKAISAQKARCSTPCKVSCPIPVVSGKECEDIFRKGGEDSQMYLIRPDPLGMPYKVYCDQTTKKGGTVHHPQEKVLLIFKVPTVEKNSIGWLGMF